MLLLYHHYYHYITIIVNLVIIIFHLLIMISVHHNLIHVFYYRLSSFFSFPSFYCRIGGGAGSCGLITCVADEGQQAKVNEREMIIF